MKDNTSKIASALRRLQTEGDSGNFVVFHANRNRNYYVQFAGERGGNVLVGEAVSNRYLEPGSYLTPALRERLIMLGWTGPARSVSENYHREWRVHTPLDRTGIAQDILQTLKGVYGFDEASDLDIDLVLQ